MADREDQGATPSFFAISLSFLSRLQRATPVNLAEASKCISMYPRPFPMKAIAFDKLHDFFMPSLDCSGKPCRRSIISDRFRRLPHASSPTIAGSTVRLPKPRCQPGPRYDPSIHLRGIITSRSLRVPAKAASLLALSRAIRWASRPSLTREVFSLTPVNSAALAIIHLALMPCQGGIGGTGSSASCMA